MISTRVGTDGGCVNNVLSGCKEEGYAAQMGDGATLAAAQTKAAQVFVFVRACGSENFF